MCSMAEKISIKKSSFIIEFLRKIREALLSFQINMDWKPKRLP